jgi:hypothetical protein
MGYFTISKTGLRKNRVDLLSEVRNCSSIPRALHTLAESQASVLFFFEEWRKCGTREEASPCREGGGALPMSVIQIQVGTFCPTRSKLQ